MDYETMERAFIEVALAGLNIERGQCIAVKAEPIHGAFLGRFARAAYARGAKFVDVWLQSAAMLRTRIDSSEESYLGFVPKHHRHRMEEYRNDRWALLSIKSPDDPATLEGVDASRLSKVTQAFSGVEMDFRRALSTDETQWLVMTLPSANWAKRVTGLSDEPEAYRTMWQHLSDILRLETSEPGRFWVEHGRELAERATTLTDLKIREMRFQAEGTDLTIGISELATWKGGNAQAPNGQEFLPNIPTEEVFTTPDFRRTNGRVRITRPAIVLQNIVEGAWFEFRDGVVVDHGADVGKETLDIYLDLDAGTRSVGEIALVDKSSPIFQSGLTFFNTLLDENATCHLALGFAYPSCIRGGKSMDDDQLRKVGANRSRQHVDFMIGSGDIDVTATLFDGSLKSIISNGQFEL